MTSSDPRGVARSDSERLAVHALDNPHADVLSSLTPGGQTAPSTIDFLQWVPPAQPAAPTAAPNPDSSETHFTMTVAEAAVALGVSCSTLRRWSDSGRLRTIRTPGRHRRFFEDDVWQLKRAADNAKPPMLRPARLPDAPIANLPEMLTNEGRALLRRAVFLLYEPGREGWFGTDAGVAQLDTWLAVVRDAAAGDASWHAVIEATDELAADGRQSGMGPADGPLLIELIGDLMQHRMFELGASMESRGAARKLLRAISRELLVKH